MYYMFKTKTFITLFDIEIGLDDLLIEQFWSNVGWKIVLDK